MLLIAEQKNRLQIIRDNLKSRSLPPLVHYQKAKTFEEMSTLALELAKVDCRFNMTRVLLLILESEIRTPRIELAMITWSARWREKRGVLVSLLFNLVVDERMSEITSSHRLQRGSSIPWPL